jgi:hypothetical protein
MDSLHRACGVCTVGWFPATQFVKSPIFLLRDVRLDPVPSVYTVTAGIVSFPFERCRGRWIVCKEIHMLRRSLAAALVMFVITGFVLAEDINGLIIKVDGNKITVKARDKDKNSTEKEYTLSKDVKITKAGKTKDDEPTKLSKDELADLAKKGFKIKDKTIDGVFAKITTKDDEVTEIKVGGGFRKKKSDQ